MMFECKHFVEVYFLTRHRLLVNTEPSKFCIRFSNIILFTELKWPLLSTIEVGWQVRQFELMIPTHPLHSGLCHGLSLLRHSNILHNIIHAYPLCLIFIDHLLHNVPPLFWQRIDHSPSDCTTHQIVRGTGITGT